MSDRDPVSIFLDRSKSNGNHGVESRRMPFAMVVAAHPDDEVIGMGACFPRMADCVLVHVTDGAPKDMADAGAAGFESREAYARARRNELRTALGIAGIEENRCLELGAADQEASLHLTGLAQRLVELILELRPEVILTHPYEGGHPDHDASAFITHAACRLSKEMKTAHPGTAEPPGIVEFTSYHAGPGGMAVHEFLPRAGYDVVTVRLSPSAVELKRRMISCFTTQRKVLSAFPVAIERFRPAPPYDFTKPPHEGRLFYENFPWGMTGERWTALAGAALVDLGIRGCL